MIFTKKYNLINNSIGWGVFLIALATYWLTLEPTASYWDCGEFIIQAEKLEIGHPPGNPIFMLTANFFTNFTTDPMKVALMVNAMSGLLSALTILLLFWTITHLVRRLVVGVESKKQSELSLTQYLVIMGSGVVGALAYTWSDTFWFSATEAEVYAFSSFCTALVFWLILKWENRADLPSSDKYLILIAYVIGVSVAVHLLNLLCIPAIVLVFAYRKFKDMNLVKSIYALLVSFAIIVFVLYGLVPGFIKVAQTFELFCVNTLGMSFNSGVMVYTIITVAVFCWSLWELYAQKNNYRIIISFVLAVLLSGMLFIGGGVFIGTVLLIALVTGLIYLSKKRLPVRILNVTMWSILVIFIGYSSYALILIRSNADTPMNQNSPDNVFALSSYLNREQYGETPLLYGQTVNSKQMQRIDSIVNYPILDSKNEPVAYIPTHCYSTYIEKGKPLYAKGVKGAETYSSQGFLSQDEMAKNQELDKSGKDFYALYDYENEIKMNPELDMFFPRIHSGSHADYYPLWVSNLNESGMVLEKLNAIDPKTGETLPEQKQPDYQVNPLSGVCYWPQAEAYRPTMSQNLEYFFGYQLNHMYWRYFMWNFAGRQNDINNQYGEKDAGNWISGISVLDNIRLGDQSLLPSEQGEGNKGHNVYYMLPLLLGIIGLVWQSISGKSGIEQFWVVFFLFFMTGIAIVLYLNQPPNQPRERDYAFAGSFYAFSIWIGIGVAGLWKLLVWSFGKRWSMGRISIPKRVTAEETEEQKRSGKIPVMMAVVACVLGLAVPLQMVSQTWDDHDRSGRYVARDFAINYLESLEPNAIIFCNGDNDTFPLWYVQEVEGVRPDVRIINLSYLNSDWYANQQRLPSYEAAAVDFTATPQDYAYGRRDVVYYMGNVDEYSVPLVDALKAIYDNSATDNQYGLPELKHKNVYIPIDVDAVLKQGLVSQEDIDNGAVLTEIPLQLRTMSLGEVLMLDIIATNAQNGWKRPIYWASTVGNNYHLGLTPYLKSVGMAYQLVPMQYDLTTDTDKAYDVVMKKYRWGGNEKATADWTPYLDETARRMFTGVRMSMYDLASQLIAEGDYLRQVGEDSIGTANAKDKYVKSQKVLELMEENLPELVKKYELREGVVVATAFCDLGQSERLNNPKLTKRGLQIFEDMLVRYAQNVKYAADFYNKEFKELKREESAYINSARKELEDKIVMSLEVAGYDTNSEDVLKIIMNYVQKLDIRSDAKSLAMQRIEEHARNRNVFTHDTQSILDNYCAIIDLYTEYGGKIETLKGKLNFGDLEIEGYERYDEFGNKTKLDVIESLTYKYYTATQKEEFNNRISRYYDNAIYEIVAMLENGEALGGKIDLESYLEELAQYAEVVTVLQSMSPDEYSQVSPDEMTVDSLYVYIVEEYLNMGGKESDFDTYPIFKQVNKARSQRLGKEYKKNNPEAFM